MVARDVIGHATGVEVRVGVFVGLGLTEGSPVGVAVEVEVGEPLGVFHGVEVAAPAEGRRQIVSKKTLLRPVSRVLITRKKKVTLVPDVVKVRFHSARLNPLPPQYGTVH